jgi:hypothetical protein
MKMSQNMKFYIIAGFLFATAATANVTVGRWLFGSNFASLPTGFTMKSDLITTTTGGTPPGMVPIGGMVAVMPSTHANAWQPPAQNVIKDGFMRADGGTIPACADCIIPAGTVLPNMVGSFAKGTSTTTGTATAAQKLVAGATGQLPPLTPTGTNSGGSVTGSNSGGSVTGSVTALSGTADSGGGHSHNYTSSSSVDGGQGQLGTKTGTNSGTQSGSIWAVGGHTHTLTGTGTWAQGTFTNPTWAQGTFTNPTFAGNNMGATNTTTQTVVPDPANVTVIWVIRVK